VKYLLDTNICIYLFRGKYDIDKRIDTVKAENCSISEITLAELVYGAEYSRNPIKNHQLINNLIQIISVIPVYDSISIYGKQKAKLRKEGRLIGDFDLLIGSVALANKMIMVTQNISEFERLDGIVIENWTDLKFKK
jgi:tRNA(fMet)-specific endonuclease VapC